MSKVPAAVLRPPSAVRPSRSRTFPWYDSQWLSAYERAKAIIAAVRPAMLDEFADAFRVLHTRADFRPVLFENMFDGETLAQIRRTTASLAHSKIELHEAGMFRRFVVHDQPFFSELQSHIVARVGDAAGEPLESSYNFLSLYGAGGVCPVHLDALEAKWTLDFCIDQSAPWPVYFSRPQPWPEPGAGPWAAEGDWAEAIKRDASNQFTRHLLTPGQAVLFSGSSQWHYRDVMPRAAGRQFCDLLFFHFIPRGTAELLKPANWARLFNVPELRETEI